MLRSTIAWPVLVALPMLSLAALANGETGGVPTGANVAAGKIVVTAPTPGSVVVKQASERGVVTWASFNLAQGNQISFVQPNAGAATLNVVTGAGASVLAGSLRSTGSVFVVDPSGVTITATGQIDTGAGFIASTLGISDADFMSGHLRFNGAGGAVVNQGRITAAAGGAVALIGGTVSNDGVISAPLGKVALGAASAATLDFGGDGFLQVLLPSAAATADGQALVSNSGRIEADGGTVMLKASTVRDAVRNAVYMPGEIRAASVSGHDGEIVLSGGDGGAVDVSGKLDASAAAGGLDGGKIDVSGASVALQGATVDATGVAQGGLVRIGGAFQGGKAQDPASSRTNQYISRFGASDAIADAATTTVDAASAIDVSATGANGAGGTAIVWSDKTTTMQGSITATGAKSGGAVEVSSASQVQSVALSRVDVGAGGALLLDPANIDIEDNNPTGTTGNVGYASNPGGTTELATSDIIAQLSAGTNLTLQASNDITWTTEFAIVQTTFPRIFGGNLNLSAGRSITLSGVFTTQNGTWSMTANDTAADGVVDAERQSGFATIDLRNATFINSNGRLNLSVLDGAGNTERDASGIDLGVYGGEGITAYISPTATGNGSTATPRIFLSDNYSTPGDIILTGNLDATSQLTTLAAPHVTWTNANTGGIFNGEGAAEFIENGVVTAIGRGGSGDAVRLALGDSTTTVSRQYGDAEPTFADIGTPQLHVLPTSAQQPTDALGNILAAGSLATSGPGVTTPVGASTLTVAPTSSVAFGSGLSSGYFIDLTPATLTLDITPRVLTPTVSGGSYTYGSPTSVASLGGIVNGDVVAPVATLNGASGVEMGVNGAGYGFGQTVPAGTNAFSLTGLAGAGAGNYTLDTTGVVAGTIVIAKKPLSYGVGAQTQTYGTLAPVPFSNLVGIVGSDDVEPVVGLSHAGTPVTWTDRLGAGTYASDVVSFTGAAAGNYAIATTGNASGVFTVNPKPVTWAVADAGSTYGTLATTGAATFTGVLAGDTVTAYVATSAGGMPVTLTSTTHAGGYVEAVGGLGGAAASNYTLSGTGDTSGTLTITPKALTYAGAASTQTYGATTLASPALQGIVGNDVVSGTQSLVSNDAVGAGASGALPVGDWQAGYSALAGAGASNYTLAPTGNVPNTVAITPKALTYAVGATSSTYGNFPTLGTATLTGLVGADAVSAFVEILGTGGVPIAADNRTHAGTYPVVASGAFLGNGGGNYVIASSGNTPGSLVVSPRPLVWSVDASNSNAIYGDAPPNVGELFGVVNGDNVSPVLSFLDGNGAIIARPHVGSYAVGVTSLLFGNAPDYVLSTTGNQVATDTVVPREITYAFNAPATSVYGTLATPVQASAVGVLTGDTVNFTNVYVANNGLVTLTAKTPAGTYREAATYDDSNPDYAYVGGGTDGTLTIAPKPITFTTTNASSTYGTAATLATATLSGVLAGDTVNAGPTTLQATGAAPAFNQSVGSYALDIQALTGAQGANYVLDEPASTLGTLAIAPKPVTYTMGVNLGGSALTGLTFTYGQLANAQPSAVPALHGLVGNDSVSVATSGPTIAESTSGSLVVGAYTYTGTTLTGAAAGNYVLAPNGNTTTASFSIAPATLNVYLRATSAASPSDPVYGSSGSYSPIAQTTGVVSGDDVVANALFVTSAGNVASVPDRLAAGTYQVVSNGGVQGADAANYAPVFHEIGMTVAPKPITASVGSSSYVYGDSPQPPVTILNGTLGGDDVSPVTTTRNGQGQAVTVTSRLGAGSYGVVDTGLAGADAANYQLVGAVPGLLPASAPGTLVVAPRTLAFAVDPSTLSLTYGQFVPPGALGGVLAGDSVDATDTAVSSVVHGGASVGSFAMANLLPAGTFTFTAALTGAQAGDYRLPAASFGTITVAPKTVTATVSADTTTYGSYVAPAITINGLVGNDSFAPVLRTTDASGNALTYGAQTDAGNYTDHVTGLQPVSSGATLNYVFSDVASGSAALTIARKQLTLAAPVAGSGTVYGDSVNLGTLGGVLFNDDAGVQVSGGGLASSRLVADTGSMYYTPRIDVGTYGWTATVVGAKAGDYTIAGMTGSFAVTPRPVIYSVDDASGQHGNYAACDVTTGCNPWSPGAVLGSAHFEGLATGDTLGGSVELLDLNGSPVTMGSSTPRGTYFEVVSGLTGAKAGDYEVATTGSRPGIFTVTPEWVSWSVSSGLFVGGTSAIVGTPGIPTLIGPNGAFSDPDLTPIVTATGPHGDVITDLSKATAGRTTFAVTGLTGADAGDFQVIPQFSFVTGPNAAPSVGTFDVYPVGLGLSLTGGQQNPVVIAPQVPAPVVTAPPLSDYTSSNKSGQMTDFGRNIDATGDAGSYTSTNSGTNMSGAADGSTTAGTTLGGDVDVSAQASGAVTGLAKFGVSGMKVEVTADAHVDVTMQVGPGYVMVGAQGDAYSIDNEDRNGVTLASQAMAGVDVQGGASGSLGGGVDGTVDATTSVFVYARSDETATETDGVITEKLSESAGVGVSAGVAGGVSGSTGSVDAGATVYSPGTIGGNFNYSAGYSNGDLSVSLDLGAEIGIGGLDLKLAFTVDPKAAAVAVFNGAMDFAGDVASLFGIHDNSAPVPKLFADVMDGVNGMGNDPAARFAYLQANPAWQTIPSYLQGDPTAAAELARQQAFFTSYTNLINNTAALAKTEAAQQATFLNLLQTDPTAAVAYSHSTNFQSWDLTNESQLRQAANQLGVQLSVSNNKLNYVDAPH